MKLWLTTAVRCPAERQGSITDVTPSLQRPGDLIHIVFFLTLIHPQLMILFILEIFQGQFFILQHGIIKIFQVQATPDNLQLKFSNC